MRNPRVAQTQPAQPAEPAGESPVPEATPASGTVSVAFSLLVSQTAAQASDSDVDAQQQAP